MQRVKGPAACQLCRMMNSFFEMQALREPDSQNLLTLSAQPSSKQPRAFGEEVLGAAPALSLANVAKAHGAELLKRLTVAFC